MRDRTRSRKQEVDEEVEEVVEEELDEEEFDEDEGEEDDEDVEDEGEEEAAEAPKEKKDKVRKPREKKLSIDPSAPEFIMHIRDSASAIKAITERNVLIGKNTFEIGHILLHIKKNKLYTSGGYKSFTQFCQSQEVGYSPAQAANLIAVVREFDRDRIETVGMTKLLPICRLKDDEDKAAVLDLLDKGELTDVKAVERVVKEKKSYPHTPSKMTDKAKSNLAAGKEKKGLSAKLGKVLRVYMTGDNGEELKSAKAVETAADPVLTIPLADGVKLTLRTENGILWVVKFEPAA